MISSTGTKKKRPSIISNSRRRSDLLIWPRSAELSKRRRSLRLIDREKLDWLLRRNDFVLKLWLVERKMARMTLSQSNKRPRKMVTQRMETLQLKETPSKNLEKTKQLSSTKPRWLNWQLMRLIVMRSLFLWNSRPKFTSTLLKIQAKTFHKN